MKRKIIFAHPKQVFESYTDYRRLIDLASFDTCFYDEINLAREAIYICAPINGEFRPALDNAKAALKHLPLAKVIFWNLERMDSGTWPPEGRNASNMVERIKDWVDLIWVSDRHYSSLDKRLKFVELGSDARLAEDSPSHIKLYDLVALTYNNERRKQIYDHLGKWKCAPESAWGPTRAKILQASRSMLYVHQTPLPVGAPLRFALAAAYKLPLLCEAMTDPYPLLEGRDFLSAPHHQLLDKVDWWLSEGRLAPLGENLHQTLCVERSFRNCVESAIKESF